jgi:hypothetical protein
MLRLAVFAMASTTLLRAQSLNIDLGHPGATRPADSYRGVGLPGRWNKFDGISPSNNIPLYGRDGALLSATAWQVGGTEIVVAPLGGAGDPAGNDRVLLGDALLTHTMRENCLFIDGLAGGTYEIVTYAWMPTVPATLSQVRIDNNATTAAVGGAWPGAQTEAGTFARHFVNVSAGGSLGIHSGVPSGGNYSTGAALDGVQIRRLEVAPSLFLDAGQLVWLTSLGATRYDAVRGSLDTLRATHGDFSAATLECLTSDLTITHLPYSAAPDPGAGFWFLVRGDGAGGPLTWDSGTAAQVASRDPGINAAPARCP